MGFFKIILDSNSRFLDQPFTYSAEGCKTGDVVTVPFGQGDKIRRGFVIGEAEESESEEFKIKQVIDKNQELSLSDEMMDTALWMRQRYGIKYSDAIKCFLPPGKKPTRKVKSPVEKIRDIDETVFSLTEEQVAAKAEIDSAVDKGEMKSFLIHGVTGSGKTELYMQAVEKVLSLGKTAIILVPEITLIRQLAERFANRFGKEKLAILHSGLTNVQRYAEWLRIRHGEVKIVIGARMAVFAPLENIGTIILDEEHEATYKADMTPKYETVDVAFKRVMQYDGIMLLGSATPSIVSRYRVEEGIYKLITLKERYNKTPMPDIEIVDMREELRNGNPGIFSNRLYLDMKNEIAKGKQVILFLNRRGFSTSIICRDCGAALKCSDCNITLTYHKGVNAGVCHYCGKKVPVPARCPECGGENIRFIGTGTEKLQEETERLFDDCIVERLDLDVTSKKRELSRILSDFEKGKVNILVGTQIIAKGLDFRNVGLTGVIDADGSLNIPDYRATERTYQLITQVAGRAGRGEEQGKVIVQTSSPDDFAIKAAVNYDYEGFVRKELRLRELMEYPPFSDLIMVSFVGKKAEEIMEYAAELKDFLIAQNITGSGENIIDPHLADVYKGKEERCSIIIKSKKGYRNKYVWWIRKYREILIEKNDRIKVIIDVNPYSMI